MTEWMNALPIMSKEILLIGFASGLVFGYFLFYVIQSLERFTDWLSERGKVNKMQSENIGFEDLTFEQLANLQAAYLKQSAEQHERLVGECGLIFSQLYSIADSLKSIDDYNRHGEY